MDTMDIIYNVFLTSMNNIKKITGFSLVAGMFLITALATSNVRTAFAQNTSTAINETASQLNETASKLMQTAAQLNRNSRHNQLTKHQQIRPQQANRNLQHQIFRILEKVWKK